MTGRIFEKRLDSVVLDYSSRSWVGLLFLMAKVRNFLISFRIKMIYSVGSRPRNDAVHPHFRAFLRSSPGPASVRFSWAFGVVFLIFVFPKPLLIGRRFRMSDDEIKSASETAPGMSLSTPNITFDRISRFL